MNITLKPAHYVLAVSGGVDSMVLLDLARKRPSITFTVAHFDHGIREDSHIDRKLVQQEAERHGLPFVFSKGDLGADTSEAQARKARYAFLKEVQKSVNADAIITAHHLDDLMETAVLNMLRGTGRKGLSSLKTTDGIIRPMLEYPKDRIKDYAHANAINWREDSTNKDTTYKRNHVRHNILTKMTPAQKAQLKILLEDIAKINKKIDTEIELMMHQQPKAGELNRKWFTSLPHSVATEVMHYWLIRNNISNITKKTIERLVRVVKTAKPRTRYDVDKNVKMHITKTKAYLKSKPKA